MTRMFAVLRGALTALGLSLAVAGSAAMTASAQTLAPSRSTTMELAILDRDLRAIDRLLASGGDIEEKLFNDETPAIMAATTDSWNIVLHLLRAGANPAAEDASGLSIASFAFDSRVAPSSREGQALAEVRQILSQRGLL